MSTMRYYCWWRKVFLQCHLLNCLGGLKTRKDNLKLELILTHSLEAVLYPLKSHQLGYYCIFMILRYQWLIFQR